MIQFDANTIFWVLVSLLGSSVASFIISWFFSNRYSLVADIVTVPSIVSRFSDTGEIQTEEGYTAYDTYIILENHSNQCFEMSDFAPLNSPHVIINYGKLQNIEHPYYMLNNPNPSAMYNNVRLEYDGKVTINIVFDFLKKGQNIEIVVHSLIRNDSTSKIKLAVAATPKNGSFICKKQLRLYHVLIQTIVVYLFLPLFIALPIVDDSMRSIMPILLLFWGPLSGKLVDYISYYGALRKIVRRFTPKHKKI